MNKVDDNKIKDSEPEEKKTEEEKKELTPGDGRCKYSSGKVNGLEKCIGCGVGYRYDTYIDTCLHILYRNMNFNY